MGKQRGTQVYSVRLEESLIESVGKWLAKRGRHPTLEPMTFTDFIRVAIREKLDKDARNKESYERGMRAKRKDDSA